MKKEDNELLQSIDNMILTNINKDIYRKLISFLDATSLDVTNDGDSIERYVKHILELTSSDKIPNVASICVSPAFIENVGIALGDNSTISITSVAGCFPLAQTYIEVKMLECAMAIENGADELDVVINVGDIIHGHAEIALSELQLLREEMDSDIIMKVIIESGELKTEKNIQKATEIAIEAGADFVKTSTGKTAVSATPEAVIVMCEVIKKHYEKTGKMIGLKVAGGISCVEDAAKYYSIVQSILGEKWLTPRYFRIGSSSLLDKLIKVI